MKPKVRQELIQIYGKTSGGGMSRTMIRNMQIKIANNLTGLGEAL